jgi:hypothetical protein
MSSTIVRYRYSNILYDPVSEAEAWYHLQTGSPAIDAGTDAGVTTDIEGTGRPQGPAHDIGATEEEA